VFARRLSSLRIPLESNRGHSASAQPGLQVLFPNDSLRGGDAASVTFSQVSRSGGAVGAMKLSYTVFKSDDRDWVHCFCAERFSLKMTDVSRPLEKYCKSI
jgi:hypothetical protein